MHRELQHLQWQEGRLLQEADASWLFDVPLDRFDQGRWQRMINCSVAVGDVASRECGVVSTDGQDTTHLRLVLPARSDMLITVAAVTTTGQPSDAAYKVRVRADAPAAPGMADAEDTSATRTFSVPNCAYNEEELYIAVDGQNEIGDDAHFQIMLAGTLSVDGVCDTYEWASTAWKECSVQCGTGEQTRAVWCQTQSGLVVDSSLCNEALKPTEMQACDVGTCEWSDSGWGACSEPCDGGEQSRLLECKNGGGKGRLVLDAHCTDPPVSTQPCNTQ